MTSLEATAIAAPPRAQPSRSEAAAHTDFSQIRYAQCWEDADVLLEGLRIRPGAFCLSIASAGDNTLALLTRRPERVVAVDLNPAQIACLELRVAAYQQLSHGELLQFIGARPSEHRARLYSRCRGLLSSSAQQFWDNRPNDIAIGFGHAGKFERYFELFRNRVLPLVHSRARVNALLQERPSEERRTFYARTWNIWRWRLMFHLFFSRFVMGRCGRDPSFFRFVEGSVAGRILTRAEHALTTLKPNENPYLHWILTGRYGSHLPVALRAENFELIRAHLDRLEWHCQSLEAYLEDSDVPSFDAFNLSDIFEYISPASYEALLDRIVQAGTPGARLVYWNTLVDRHRPDSFSERLRSLDHLSQELHAADKAFFYCALHVEEVI